VLPMGSAFPRRMRGLWERCAQVVAQLVRACVALPGFRPSGLGRRVLGAADVAGASLIAVCGPYCDWQVWRRRTAGRAYGERLASGWLGSGLVPAPVLVPRGHAAKGGVVLTHGRWACVGSRTVVSGFLSGHQSEGGLAGLGRLIVGPLILSHLLTVPRGIGRFGSGQGRLRR
jgi:hypothetical protein